jgi:hypothetical protein
MGRHQQRGTVGENRQQKEITIHCEGVSKNHTTTTIQVTAELNVHLDDPVSTKTVQT